MFSRVRLELVLPLESLGLDGAGLLRNAEHRGAGRRGRTQMSKIALVGLGLVGRAWAVSFARAGHEVSIWDERAEAVDEALAFVNKVLPELDAHDLLNGEAALNVRARMRRASSYEEALEGASHVQENTPEDLETKRRVFAELDRAAEPDAVLASSTSAILPSLFTETLRGRARCLVAHPINPPYLIPAVEIVPAPWTGADVVERTAALFAAAGHAPIVVKREIDGFIVNRLQGALLEEAFRLVADGFASTEDVDVALRDGLGLRWSFMGPFETIDLNAPGGVRDYAARYQHIYARIFPSGARADWSGPAMEGIEAERRARLPANKLDERAVWRDRRLMALAAHKKRAEGEIGK
jgi:L-gulonate 3-dehydrogenase